MEGKIGKIMDDKKKIIIIASAVLVILLLVLLVKQPQNNTDNQLQVVTTENETQLQVVTTESEEHQQVTTESENQQQEATESEEQQQAATENEEQQQVVASEDEEQQEASTESETQYTFRSNKLLKDHFYKHGKEMGFKSPEEYEQAASAVVNNPDALHKTEKEDGDDVYYVEKTNEFVVVSTDGYIRTYFNPSDGINYYNRQ